jgi:hypothetical protein
MKYLCVRWVHHQLNSILNRVVFARPICISIQCIRVLRQGVLCGALIVGVVLTGGNHEDVCWHIDSRVNAWLLGLAQTTRWMCSRWLGSLESFNGVA